MREVQLVSGEQRWSDATPLFFESGGISARHSSLPGHGFEYAWQGKAHYLALHDLQLRDGELRTEGQGPDRARDLRGRITFLPAESRTWGWCVPAATKNSFTALYFDPRSMDEEMARRFSDVAIVPRVHFSDPALFITLTKLRNALRAPDEVEKAYLDSLLSLCALEVCQLLKHHETPAVLPGRLSPLQERRLYDYVEAHLDSDIGLEDLARAAGLSRFHLIRTFKTTTGTTPYQYLLTRRIERACGLLREGRLTAEAVAQKVGFKSSSHFIRRFRQLNGTTPGVYAEATGPAPGHRKK